MKNKELKLHIIESFRKQLFSENMADDDDQDPKYNTILDWPHFEDFGMELLRRAGYTNKPRVLLYNFKKDLIKQGWKFVEY